MLGPPLDTFKPNKVPLVVVVLVALPIGFLLTIPTAERGARIFWASVLAVLVLLFVWLLSLRVSLHQEGISYHSLLGEKEMRWDELEKFYYTAAKHSVNFIPIGTYYWFKLIDVHGRKLSFGNRIEHPSELGAKLIEHTTGSLLPKAADWYNNGVELDFGPLRISRPGGVKRKKWVGFKEIPWDQVASYAINEGRFYIWQVGEKRTSGYRLGKVPNAFVLLALLDEIFRPEPPAAGVK